MNIIEGRAFQGEMEFSASCPGCTETHSDSVSNIKVMKSCTSGRFMKGHLQPLLFHLCPLAKDPGNREVGNVLVQSFSSNTTT